MAREEGRLNGARIGRSGLVVSDLLFVDDSILFSEATIEGANTMKSIMFEYEGVSS